MSDPRPSPDSAARLLVTAGPTHEPIDAVRYIGNRSSGRLGIALAEAAAAKGWNARLLLGPTPLQPTDTGVRTRRFLTTSDLQALLAEEVPGCDVLVMAAAVADYRPVPLPGDHDGKLPRLSGPLSLRLEPTPDLLAGVAEYRRPDQLIVGFALEPRSRLVESAARKLERKKLDLIVANPLETMDSGTIEATVLGWGGRTVFSSPGPLDKGVFAHRLLQLISAERARLAAHPEHWRRLSP